MKTEGNVDEFADTVNGKLAEVRTAIRIFCKMQIN